VFDHQKDQDRDTCLLHPGAGTGRFGRSVKAAPEPRCGLHGPV